MMASRATSKSAVPAAPSTPLKAMSVRLENKPGSLARVLRAVAEAGVNLEGVEAEVLGEFGFFRFYTKDAAAAERALRAGGYIVTVTEILEVVLEEKAGELARVYETLAQGKVNGESCFGSNDGGKTTRVFLRVSDATKGSALLAKAGFRVFRHAH